MTPAKSDRLVLLRLPACTAVLAAFVLDNDAQYDILDPADKVRFLNCQMQLGRLLVTALKECEFGTPS